jgi:hypothetical protein
MNIEISNGDLIDKLTILEIKKDYITDKIKLQNIYKEYQYIKNCTIELLNYQTIYLLYTKLKQINLQLWQIEDHIRIKEKNKIFDQEFIDLARKVYMTNDERANIKKQINIDSNSSFIEEKSYEQY